MIVRDFNISFLLVGHSDKNEIKAGSDIINQVDLTDIVTAFHPNTKEYTFFIAPHGTFSKIDNISDTKQLSTGTRK